MEKVQLCCQELKGDVIGRIFRDDDMDVERGCRGVRSRVDAVDVVVSDSRLGRSVGCEKKGALKVVARRRVIEREGAVKVAPLTRRRVNQVCYRTGVHRGRVEGDKVQRDGVNERRL